MDCRRVGAGEVFEHGDVRPVRACASMRTSAPPKRTHEAVRKSTARSVTAENYSGVGRLGETEAISGPPKREADRAQTTPQRA